METKDPIERLREWATSKEHMVMSPCKVRKVEEFADEIEAQYMKLPVVEAQYMKLPVDADGEVLRIGDEVWLHDGLDSDPRIVRGYGMSNGRDVDVFLNHADEGWCPNTVTVPDVLCHRKPDTVESLLEKFWSETDGVVFPGDKDGLLEKKKMEYAERIRKVVRDDR